MNIPDMAYHQWEGMAAACDSYVEKNASKNNARRLAGHRRRH